MAHFGHWTAGSWILLGVFLGLLGLGIALVAAAVRDRARSRAHVVLAERLAMFGPRRVLAPIALALTTLGLIGATVVGATAGPGFMHGMMSGGMGSMMGGGDTERSGRPPVSGARELRVTAREFSFQPFEIRVREGETVNLAFENRGHMFHTLTIGALGLDLRANGGDQIAAALLGDRAGSYPFVCAVPGHAAAGMRGTVIVSESS
ncbi:MAG: cupredoxin domain-containing protein [Actinomycetota bacterium]